MEIAIPISANVGRETAKTNKMTILSASKLNFLTETITPTYRAVYDKAVYKILLAGTPATFPMDWAHA